MILKTTEAVPDHTSDLVRLRVYRLNRPTPIFNPLWDNKVMLGRGRYVNMGTQCCIDSRASSMTFYLVWCVASVVSETRIEPKEQYTTAAVRQAQDKERGAEQAVKNRESRGGHLMSYTSIILFYAREIDMRYLPQPMNRDVQHTSTAAASLATACAREQTCGQSMSLHQHQVFKCNSLLSLYQYTRMLAPVQVAA